MRFDGCRSALGGGGLRAEEHELRALHRARIGAGRDVNVFVEGLGFEPEPLTLDRFNVLSAPNEHHIVSGACQHAAVVAAHRTRAHCCDFHRRPPGYPAGTILPNGKTSIRWRNASAAKPAVLRQWA